MQKLKAKTLDLTYWRGYYETVTVKIGDINSELLKSENRPNTETNNKWNVSTTFTQIRFGRCECTV